MTNEQSTALRLAELLEAVPFIGFVFDEQPGVEDPGLAKDAAAMLRKLYVHNTELENSLIKKSIAIQKIWKERDELRQQQVADEALLRQAYKAMGLIGADLVCEAAHHNKEDRHAIGEPCLIQKRWHETFAAIKERLK